MAITSYMFSTTQIENLAEEGDVAFLYFNQLIV